MTENETIEEWADRQIEELDNKIQLYDKIASNCNENSIISEAIEIAGLISDIQDHSTTKQFEHIEHSREQFEKSMDYFENNCFCKLSKPR